MTTPALSEVYKGLREVGLTKGQVGAILPDWWQPEIAVSEAGLWETVVLLGRRLSLDAGSLLQGEIRQTSDVSPPRFKHTVRVTAAQLSAAALIASSLARAILGATPYRGEVGTRDAASVRMQILSDPHVSIDFDSLLQHCWEAGIPVIPLPNLPKGVRKMDAAAIKIGSRPAIIIALRNNSKAWLSFLLAHELGHIYMGHVPDNTAIIEGSIRDSTEFDAESQQDAQEVEANAFAHTLLGGANADGLVSNWPLAMPAVSLASRATDEARALRTAPGHLILRHGFMNHRWPEARMALNFLADDMDAQISLIERMKREIDTASIADDLQDYVEQITGLSSAR